MIFMSYVLQESRNLNISCMMGTGIWLSIISSILNPQADRVDYIGQIGDNCRNFDSWNSLWKQSMSQYFLKRNNVCSGN